MEKRCVLDEERLCVDCGECMTCDLDPEKLCDNCMRCVEKSGADYLAIEIDEVISGTSEDANPEFSVRKAASGGKPSAKAPAVRAVRPKTPRKRS